MRMKNNVVPVCQSVAMGANASDIALSAVRLRSVSCLETLPCLDRQTTLEIANSGAALVLAGYMRWA